MVSSSCGVCSKINPPSHRAVEPFLFPVQCQVGVKVLSTSRGRALPLVVRAHGSKMARRLFSSNFPPTPISSEMQIVCEATLTGHQGAVWSVAWNPSGTQLASSSGDKTVRIWSRLEHPQPGLQHQWQCTAILEDAHTRTVRACAWAPNGRYLATASFDATTAIWEQASGGVWEQVGGCSTPWLISPRWNIRQKHAASTLFGPSLLPPRWRRWRATRTRSKALPGAQTDRSSQRAGGTRASGFGSPSRATTTSASTSSRGTRRQGWCPRSLA